MRHTGLIKIDAARFDMALARTGKAVKEVTIESGVSRNTVSRAVSGRGVRPATLGRIASALGVEVSEIVAYEDWLKPE